jgi:hypothetical protein
MGGVVPVRRRAEGTAVHHYTGVDLPSRRWPPGGETTLPGAPVAVGP